MDTHIATGSAGRATDAASRLRRDRLAANLVALFGADDTSIADDLLELGEWARIPGGRRLFRQGDAGDSMYVVVAGRLVATCEDAAGHARVVGQIRAGECVGEMGLLASQPRTATVHASRDTVVIRVSEEALQQVVARHPQFVASTARLVIRRTSELIRGDRPLQRPKNIAVVPLRRSVAGPEFVERLRRALQRRGPTLVVDRARAEATLSAHGVAPGSADEGLVLSAWLDEQELQHDSLVFETELPADDWTERCLRQADVVLLVASFGDASGVDGDEARLARGDAGGPPRELVLLHPPGAGPPSGTGRWLAGRAVARHHHVRWDRDDDFARLARVLTGGAIGLVLGGGGARGFAHLGVVRALREAGIPLDALGGTSQGAIVAATVALDWDDATIERVHREGFTERNPIGDYALVPHLALVKGKRLDEALQRCFGERHIEDAWLPFFCTSADLALARCEVHRRGPLWKALRAGVSIPGILPPVVLGEHLHVDGAILDNLPVEPMRASGVGRIIAVDLSVGHEQHMTLGELPSALDYVRARLLGGGEHAAPGIGSILVKSLMLSSVQRARELGATVDLLLEPAPAEIGFLEWSALDRGMALGYRHAKQELARRRGLEAWAHA